MTEIFSDITQEEFICLYKELKQEAKTNHDLQVIDAKDFKEIEVYVKGPVATRCVLAKYLVHEKYFYFVNWRDYIRHGREEDKTVSLRAIDGVIIEEEAFA